MGLFQTSIIKKYLLGKDTEISTAYQKYVAYFHNPDIQENIRNIKEEQFQEGFLRELFVKVFGYTLNPGLNYNLITEQKNEKGSKKADGAILVNDEVVGIIELKDSKTTALKQVESQAFGYKHYHKNATYVIISNFQKLRFYIDNAVECEEFDLFLLSRERFAVLWLCLDYQNISTNLPKQIKAETSSSEDQITKQLYKDYATFKRALFADLTENNSILDRLTLFKKSQKILDRLLFILFAEDCGLLPPNSIEKIIKQWELLKENDAYEPLYNRLKKYFGYMNTGYKGKQHDVFAYNGGLFLVDDVLENVVISDDVLLKNLHTLSKYDYSSEVDVNILGHIFENSLTEIEEVTNALSTDKGINPIVTTIGKRKKDGVFYTPRYITTYIVENTLGKLCTDKKAELEIDETEYFSDKKRQVATRKKLNDKLTEYRNWLLSLTICDPACGSGAFLNAALDFLMAEHRLVDEMSAKILGNSIVFPDIENAILENNLFGVDINDESVEIAKLALWLRTAKPQRKLNSLNNNIKCGNSLISDPEIAGEKAFDWQKEFPQVFREKQKRVFHITTAIHDSRTSQRMVVHKVRQKRFNGMLPDPQVYPLSAEDEIIITKTIAEVVKEDDLNVLAYNICYDHLHILLVCEADELDKIVGQLKGRTARSCNNHKGINPLVKEEGERSVPLWTQKFGCKEITDEKQLYNTIEYIENNRTKHELPTNKGLQPLVKEMTCTYAHAFRVEYNGGFDVVIGNPPYVKEYINKAAFDGLHTHPCYQGKMDLWYFFGSLALDLIKEKTGLIGFIAQNNWVTNAGASVFRNIVLEKGKLVKFVDFGDYKVFESAGIQTMIYIMSHDSDNKWYSIQYSKILNKKVNQDDVIAFLEKQPDSRFRHSYPKIDKPKFLNNFILFTDDSKEDIFSKIEKADVFYLTSAEIAQGIVAPQDFVNKKSQAVLGSDFRVGQGIFNLSQEEYNVLNFTEREKDLVRPFYTTNQLGRYYGNSSNEYWVIYTDSRFKNPDNILPYPTLKSHLDKFDGVITSDNKPYGLHRARDVQFFTGEKVMSLRKTAKPIFTYTDFDCYVSQSYNVIKTARLNAKVLTAILNSSLIAIWLWHKGKIQGDLFQIDKEPLLNIPLKKPVNETPFIEKVDKILSLSSNLQAHRQRFLKRLSDNFGAVVSKEMPNKGIHPLVIDSQKAASNNKGMNPLVITNALARFDELDFKQFLAELKKQKITLSLNQQDEWEKYFSEYKKECNTIAEQISATDKEIDVMVYGLYGLEPEDIKIIEGE